jgi:hypothetical protein
MDKHDLLTHINFYISYRGRIKQAMDFRCLASDNKQSTHSRTDVYFADDNSRKNA